MQRGWSLPPRADFNTDETGAVVTVEDLFDGNYVSEH